jgi:CheY-like chemotaxis protein
MLNRIVLIDDSEPDLIYSRIVLERVGLAREVHAFESARDALAWLTDPDSSGADLILLDINMPGMDGFAFLDALKQARGCEPDISLGKVVMLTSSPDPGDRDRAATYPCVRGYLVKPLDKAVVQTLPALLGT